MQCWTNCEGSVFLRPGKLFCLLNKGIVDFSDLIPLLAKGCWVETVLIWEGICCWGNWYILNYWPIFPYEIGLFWLGNNQITLSTFQSWIWGLCWAVGKYFLSSVQSEISYRGWHSDGAMFGAGTIFFEGGVKIDNHIKFAKSPVFEKNLLLRTSCSYEISDLCLVFFKKIELFVICEKICLVSHLSSRMGRYKEKLVSTPWVILLTRTVFIAVCSHLYEVQFLNVSSGAYDDLGEWSLFAYYFVGSCKRSMISCL